MGAGGGIDCILSVPWLESNSEQEVKSVKRSREQEERWAKEAWRALGGWEKGQDGIREIQDEVLYMDHMVATSLKIQSQRSNKDTNTMTAEALAVEESTKDLAVDKIVFIYF